jgi:alpha-1,3-rhamnosyl/mannosyltransferase
LYVDPVSTESIAQAMVKISNDEQLRLKLIAAGKERNKQFTWKRTAEKVVGVYRKLAGI